MTDIRPPHSSGRGNEQVRFRRTLSALERGTLAVESPVRRLAGSNRLNPLPHAGTISVFLLVVVTVTGLYLTFFFSFGFEASYESVARLEAHPIQRFMRALHRYSSAALVLTTLVHAWRSFVMARFTGPRRWRWVTGVAALVIVWLAGVTGYWLIWDVRAQAVTEALIRLVEGFRLGADFVIDSLVGPGAGTGWQILLAIWAAHLLLTGVIAWFLWRHLRRTRHGWLPPRHWMWIMGGTLVLVSILVPAGMLAAADFSTVPGSMPLDPFFLFLLPLFRSGAPWLVVAAGGILTALVVGIPWFLRRSDPGVVEIDEEACTGCNLCVVDCPYEALTLVERADGGETSRQVAVVSEADCVACGICIGSCSFAAMELPGYEAAPAPDVRGRQVIVTCERHRRQAPSGASDAEVIAFPCTGMLHPQMVGRLIEAGANGVQVIGCPPADCAFGLGNGILAERLEGERRPHVPRKWEGRAAEDWVAPGTFAATAARPGEHPSADSRRLPARRTALIGAVVVVLASVAAVALLTDVPWNPIRDSGELVVAVEHVVGRQIEGQPGPTGSPESDPVIVVEVDGERLVDETLRLRNTDGGTGIVFFRTFDVEPGTREVRVALDEGGAVPTVLAAGPVAFEAGRREVVEAFDVPPPADAVLGEQIFFSASLAGGAGCQICHSIEPGQDGVGPTLYGIASQAGSRIPGLSAEDYLRESILDPDAYVVEGYPAGQMLPIYEDRLSPEEIDALVAYLMTLTEGG